MSAQLQIAMTSQFQKAALALSHRQHARVHEAILKLAKGLEAVHLHALKGAPFVSFVVNQDALRVICQRDDDVLLLLHVAGHEAAYDWAARHQLVQLGDAVRIIETQLEHASPPAVDPADERPPGPLAGLVDERFAELDVAPRAASVLREVPDDDALIEVALCCRPALGAALFAIGTDPDDWAEALAAYRRPTEQAPSLAKAIGSASNSAAFRLFAPGEDAWAAAMAAGDEVWRLFLHPTQRRLVERRASGALKVTGGPGTGKTVVALHRVQFLLERVFADDPRPVLLTTFSRALCAQLEVDLASLLAGREELLARVVVRTTTAVASELLGAAGRPAHLLDGEVAAACWEAAMERETAGRPRAFYEAERDRVLARWGVWDGDAYLKTKRTDRRERLTRPERAQIWTVLEAFEVELAQRGGGDRVALAREAARLLRSGELAPPYAAVVCDEIQDVSAPELRLLAALARAADGDGIRPDALMLVGDGYQRVYGHPVRPSHCGIEIRGRSLRLGLNYRTTEGIRRAAVASVTGLGIDELDEGGEGDPLAGYRSLRPGPLPERVAPESVEAEADWLVAQLRAHPQQTLILARTNARLRDCRQRLVARGIEPLLMSGQSARPGGDVPVVLCTMHRAKGLEAPRVVVLRDGWPAPWPGADAADKDDWARRERCLMYVAISRAREWCAVVGR